MTTAASTVELTPLAGCPSLAGFLGAALTFTGCEQHQVSRVEQVTLQERLLAHSNPTNFEFNVTISDVKDAIKKAFDKWQDEQTTKYHKAVWKGRGDAETKRLQSLSLQMSGLTHLLWRGDGDALTHAVFTASGNENDAYIYGADAPFGESLVYFKDGQPLIYYADFHIHLTAVGSQKIRVEIFTYDSSVVAGADTSWSPHGPAFIGVKVHPTTIEQYQILLRIGEQLGTKDMPQLVLPETNSSLRKITLPRER